MQAPWTFPTFERKVTEPVLLASPSDTFRCPVGGSEVRWRWGSAFNPAATTLNGKICLLFRAEDGAGDGIGRYTSRLGLAESEDGVQFQVRPEPVVFPAKDKMSAYEWPGGCEDPRVVYSEDGEFVLTYTAWDRKVARLSVATSTDLVNWKKRGPAFGKAEKGKWLDTWSKAGSIVCEARGDKLVAVKIGGKYWMYWGEGLIHAASSTNLRDWTPIADPGGRLLELVQPRTCTFDSELVEPGPPAVLTKQGIVLLFNAKNDASMGDPSITAGAYTTAQALFSADDPTKLLDRTNWPFLRPETPFERTGQYLPGSTFAEGLVPLKGRWLMYYGCADSSVGVVEAPRK